jgi:predicted membrane GTPase involved in stress response
MNFDLPIEQLVRRTDTRFQLGFATEAKERLRTRDEFALSPSRRGLHVLARNEDGLAAPVSALRDAYGPSLEVGPPTVRLIEGVQVQEPIMHVRIALETGHQEAVKQVLLARGARLEEAHARSRRAVLRCEAPLARLLGLPAELNQLTAGNAQYWIVLSHYALVTRDPGGRAA